MTKYGTSRYGSGFKYGETTSVNVYYNSGLTAFSYDYNTVNLSWSRFTTDPADGTVGSSWYWKLTKSYVGVVDNPEDAVYVTGGVYGGSSASFQLTATDIDYVNIGKEVTYTLWVFTGTVSSGGTGVWINCGSSRVILLGQTDTLARLSSWVPRAWLNDNGVAGDAEGEANSDNSLEQTLYAFSLVYDMFRAETNLLTRVSDNNYIPVAIANKRVTDFGFNYEISLGDSYNRSLTSLGYYIGKYRGTAAGINIYTNGLTHWNNQVTIGHNLLLDYNDSSFEESVGTWTASSGTWVSAAYPTAPTTPQPPTGVLYDLTNLPRQVGYGKLTTTSTTPVTITGSVPVPITGNTRYVFSGWVEHLNNAATVSTTITWKDRFYNTISTTSAPTATTTTTSWQEFTSKSDSGRNGQLAPVNAFFATIIITVTPSSSSSSSYLFDYFQLAEYTKSFEYEDARRVRVNVRGQKENYMSNPDFEYGLTGWSGYNGTLSIDSGTSAAVVHGTSAALLTSTVSGTASFVSDWNAVDPGSTVTFSGYVMGSAALNATVMIEFSSQANTTTQATVLSDSNGRYYPTTVYSATSSALTLSTTATQQIYVTAVVPPYTKDSGWPLAKVTISFAGASVGTKFWLDGALLEESLTPSRYFSGSGGIDPTNPNSQTYYNINNCRWEIRNMFNYMSNPSLETNTTDWSAITGTTISRVSSDNGYTTAYDGTYFLKVAYGTTQSVAAVAYLPWAALGGEDFTFSAYVRGPAGTYTLTGPNSSGTATFIVSAANAGVWTRVAVTTHLIAGQTSATFTVSSNNGTYFHIDGAQAEYGRRVSPFVSSSGTSIVALNNPLTSGKYIYAYQGEAAGGGKGNYLYNYNLKTTRLKATLPLVAPMGSTTAIKTGIGDTGYQELTESLIPSASFEKDLGYWVGNNATLSRSVNRGSVFGDNTSHGQGYCKVTTVNGTANFGISTGKIYITPNASFYSSVAIRPETGSAGTYTFTTVFYDANNNVIYTGTTSSSITLTTRWGFMSVTHPVGSIVGSAYAIVTVTCAPTSFASGQTFDIDRVVFRQ